MGIFGILGGIYRKMLPRDIQKELDLVESLYNSGKISQKEAERRRADLEESLRKVLDARDEEEKKDA